MINLDYNDIKNIADGVIDPYLQQQDQKELLQAVAQKHVDIADLLNEYSFDDIESDLNDIDESNESLKEYIEETEDEAKESELNPAEDCGDIESTVADLRGTIEELKEKCLAI